jgi:hypothetical protein
MPTGRAGIACPGFVDLQVNGFAGVDFLATDADGYRRARRALASTGVTAFQPTLISSPPEVIEAALAVMAEAQREPGPASSERTSKARSCPAAGKAPTTSATSPTRTCVWRPGCGRPGR